MIRKVTGYENVISGRLQTGAKWDTDRLVLIGEFAFLIGIHQEHASNSAENFTSNNLETDTSSSPCSLGDCNITSFMRQERGAKGDFGNPSGQM
jgi:hypothetical protein